jgi:hypothetical protein
MTGFLGFAPIYVNGLLALFVVFVLPGMVLVRAFDIPNVPQRWLAIFLGSMTFNHLFVTLIALLHLAPVTSYRAAVAAMVGVLAAVSHHPGGARGAGRSIRRGRDGNNVGYKMRVAQPGDPRDRLFQCLEVRRSPHLR